MLDPKLMDEPGRLAALDRLDVLDTPPEAQFEKIIGLVRAVLGVPIATVTLVAADRQWFKARAGMPHAETPRDVSFCTHTIQHREPLVVEDALADPRFRDSPLVAGPPYIRAYAGVPIETGEGYNVGALCAIDTKPREFTSAQLAVLADFASLVVGELELRHVASIDHLTGAMTRRAFAAGAADEISRARRYDRPAALIALDVDHFKRVNDGHGHPAGDVVLRGLVARCRSALRKNDLMGRMGGEEFAILLPETANAEAAITAERLRTAVAEQPFDVPGAALAVTASFGIAPLAGIATLDEWLQVADAALYAAKRAGRDRCVSADRMPAAASDRPAAG